MLTGQLLRNLMTESNAVTIGSGPLRQLLDAGTPPRILDVRSPAEFETAHIAGSYNVPLDLLRGHRDKILEHLDPDVVLVCRSGQRATQAEDILRTAGLHDVRVLDGGITAWETQGHNVDRGAQRWDLERQVRLVAGSAVVLSILGSVGVPKVKWLAAAMGGGLAIAALTDTCATGSLLSRLPYNRGAGCDLQDVVARLASYPPARTTAS
jgi:rhodanese-related sulfurtransferase